MNLRHYPLARPVNSYRSGAGAFGANRANGRKHAGCDLYAPPGTPVFAVASGIVGQLSTDFMGGNPPGIGAVTINHTIFVCRYAEIRPMVKSGQSVRAGQQIGTVQNLVFRSGFTTSMVHFEMFTGLLTGPLSDRKNPPRMRRKDLINPTFFLTLLEFIARPVA